MISVRYMVLGQVQTNVYFLINDETKECILIDPAARADLIRQQLCEQGLTPAAILLTHGHYDHIGAISALREAYSDPLLKIYAMEEEEALLADPALNHSAMTGLPISLKADELLRDRQTFSLADISLLAIHTPGHTRGGGCYYLKEEALLFAGDTLFWHSIGRSDLPTGNEDQLISSIREKLFILPDETLVLPGHGGETTIGDEKKYNPYVRL